MKFLICPDFHHRFSPALPIRTRADDGMSVEEASLNWVARRSHFKGLWTKCKENISWANSFLGCFRKKFVGKEQNEGYKKETMQPV